MITNDVKDTIESRKQILKYFNYLKSGDENIPYDFYKHVIENVLTLASLQALETAMKRYFDNIDREKALKNADVEEKKYSNYRDALLCGCLELEIEHNHTKEDSVRMNPQLKDSHIIIE